MAQVTGVMDVGALLVGRAPIALADANKTLIQGEYENHILTVTGTLTAQRNLVLPLTDGMMWLIYNNTTGGFGIQAIGASGTGIVIAATKHALVYSDGTNILRATADA